MCYNPYDHNAMLHDSSARTAGVEAPDLRLTPVINTLARVVANIFARRARHEPAATVNAAIAE